MSEDARSGTLRTVMRVFVTLALLVFCAGTEVFLLPTYFQMVASGGGSLAEWATAPLGVMPWVVGLMIVGAVVMTARAGKEARLATTATALAVVDVALVLWVISIGLFLLDFAITIPKFG